MKYAVKELYLRDALPGLGTRCWMDSIKNGGYTSCEANEDTRMVALVSPARTLRIPYEYVASLQYKMTPAAVAAK